MPVNKTNNFIVLCQPRTGSNLLLSLLEKHSDITVEYEPLHNLEELDAIAKTMQLLRVVRPTRVFGFKVFYYPYYNRTHWQYSLWKYLAAQPDLRVIHLQRQNFVRSMVSRNICVELARTGVQSNPWILYESEQRPDFTDRQVNLDVNHAIREIKNYQTMQQIIGETFAARQLLNLYYEDLVNNQQETLAAAFSHLGVENQITTSPLKQQNPEKLDHLIKNYSEFKSSLESQFGITVSQYLD